ncbi:hypothetical protein [Rhodohalobacter sp. 8-1]|uniref:hypothetical protein n=1 Tax=Rhodohalobacter sp. 8-1 TaxID=3131972 RepID=UPI0030EE9529
MMNQLNTLPAFAVILSFALIFSSCGNLTSSDGELSDSLEPVENVTPISGAQNSTLTVNKHSTAYFELEFQNIEDNDVFTNGHTGDGWCIDWKVAIDSNNASYTNIPLYSTFNVEKWNPLNFLFNIKDDLMAADPELTYREIQLVVWSLRGFPEFNINEIPLENLPSRMKDDGKPNFSYDKVETILQIVEEGYKEFNFTEGTKYAVIAETPSDVQTVITVVE